MCRQSRVTLVYGLILGLAVGFGGIRSLTAQTVNITEPTQVFSQDDLRSIGFARLSDLFHHIDEARSVSLDGFGVRSSVSGIGSFHEAPLDVFVDGHPLDFGLLGSGDLNLIALPVEGIDRVEVYARPTLISGVFAAQGAIHIFTKLAEEATELHGRGVVGIHDAVPGALSYDNGERTTSDVEGTDIEVSALGGSGNGSALAALVHRRYVHADRADGQGRPLTVVTSPFTAITWSSRRVHLSVIGLGTTSERFSYLPYTSDVLAADFHGAAASATAAHRIGDRSFLRHRVTIDFVRAHYGRDSNTWNENSFLWTSALARTLEERLVVLGGAAELRRVHTETMTGNVRWGSIYAAIAGRMAPQTQYRGGGMVALDGRSVAVKAYGGITSARWEKHRADVYVAVVDGLLHEQNAADHWAREGLTPPLFPNEVTRPPEDVATKATFDAGWRWTPVARQEVRVGIGIRRSQKIYLPSTTPRPAGGGLRESIDFDYTSGTQGVLWGEFTTHVLPGRQRLFWSWQRTIAGEDTYDEAWDAVPDLRAGFSFETPMLGGFRMRGNVTRETGRMWRQYDAVPNVGSDLGGKTMVDIYITKRLFSGLFRASVGVQNALGEDIIYHPMGDTFGRSVRVDIRLDLVRRH